MRSFLLGLIGLSALVASPLILRTEPDANAQEGGRGAGSREWATLQEAQPVDEGSTMEGTLPPHGQDPSSVLGTVAGGIDVGSDGSDGIFKFIPDVPPNGATMTIDLGLAASLCDCDGIDQGGDGNFLDDSCRWNCPSPLIGGGVYDSEQWAVVFKYSSFELPAGKTVKFRNHPKRTPVVLLIETTATIGGVINSTAQSYSPNTSGFDRGRCRVVTVL
jgi:hypothetical protein